MLTKSQIAAVERAATMAGEVVLYRSTSMSGDSETLRCLHRYYDERYRIVRSRSWMILSQKINVLPDGNDDPESWKLYETKVKIAEEMFCALRRAYCQTKTE